MTEICKQNQHDWESHECESCDHMEAHCLKCGVPDCNIQNLLTEERQKAIIEVIEIIKNGGTGDTVGLFTHNAEKYINERQLVEAIRGYFNSPTKQ